MTFLRRYGTFLLLAFVPIAVALELIMPERIVREVISIFRHEAVEKLFQIVLRGGVGIFHDDDAATGVLNKNRDCSVSHSAVVDLRLHLIGDFVESFAVAAHFELVVMHMHSRSRYFSVAIRAKQGAAVSSPPFLRSAV